MQVVGQLHRCPVAPRRVPVHRLEHHRLQVARHFPAQGARPRRILVADLLDQLGMVGRVERRPQRQELVKGQPQPVDVGARVAPSLESLRGHVAQCSQEIAGPGQAVVLALGQPKVGHPHRSLLVQHQVGRLDVTVQHAAGMGVGQRLGDLDADARDGVVVGAATDQAAERLRGPCRRHDGVVPTLGHGSRRLQPRRH